MPDKVFVGSIKAINLNSKSLIDRILEIHFEPDSGEVSHYLLRRSGSSANNKAVLPGLDFSDSSLDSIYAALKFVKRVKVAIPERLLDDIIVSDFKIVPLKT